MVKYNLCIQKDGVSKKIDLSSIIGLEDNKSLKVIDEFTAQFFNELELKKYLIRKKLIEIDEWNCEINITYKYENEKNLPIIYSYGKKYMNEKFLQEELNKLLYDINFLKFFVNHYKSNYLFNYELYSIQSYINNVERNGGYNFLCESLNNAINNILKIIIRENNYKNIRELASLIYKYNCLIKVDKVSLKDSNLSNDGDPDFPYNSEEEYLYYNYMENLYNRAYIFDDNDENTNDWQLKL